MTYDRKIVYQSEKFRVITVEQIRDQSNKIMDPHGYSKLSTTILVDQCNKDSMGDTRWDNIGSCGGTGYAVISTKYEPLMDVIVELLKIEKNINE